MQAVVDLAFLDQHFSVVQIAHRPQFLEKLAFVAAQILAQHGTENEAL